MASLVATTVAGTLTATGDITTNSTSHAVVKINSSAANRASWVYHAQGGTTMWLAGVELSETRYQLYSNVVGSTGVKFALDASGNGTFSGNITLASATGTLVSTGDLYLGTDGNDDVLLLQDGAAIFSENTLFHSSARVSISTEATGLNTPAFLTIEGPSIGNTVLSSNQWAIMIGPKHNRSSVANVYYPGIAFNMLLNYNNGTSYDNTPNAWIGTRFYDTSGSERASLVFATKQGTGTTASDVPIERMTIDPFGNVGIGDTTPTYLLDVNGTGRFTGVLRVDTGINHNGTTILNSSRELINIAELAINAAAAGTYKLHCNGTANFAGALTGTTGAFSGAITGYTLAVTADNSGWNPGIDLINTNADSSPCYLRLEKISASPANNDYIGFINMRGRNSAGEIHNYIEQVGVATNVANGSESSRWGIGTWKLGVEYPTTLFCAGNDVGMGVTPTAVNTSHRSLQIGGNANIQSYGTKGAGGEVDYCHNVYLNQDGNYKLISADEGTMYRQGGGKHQFYGWASSTAGSNVTVNAAANSLTILQGGSVGIGTSAPSAPLEVVGADSGITISSATSNRPHLRLVNGTTNMLQLSCQSVYAAIGDGTDANRYMSFKAGKVGVNRVDPSYQLDVNGTGRFTGQLTLGTGIIHGSTTILNSSRELINIAELAINAAAAGTYKLHCNGTANFAGALTGTTATFTSAPVVIGAADGGGTLHLQHNTNGPELKMERADGSLTGQMGLISFGNRNYEDYLCQIRATCDSTAATAAGGGGFLSFDTEESGGNLTERMRIQADGNVGIATAAPAATLDVRRISAAASKWIAAFCSDNQTLATARAHDSVLIQASDVPCLKIYEAASTPQVATLAVGDGNATLASSNTLRLFVNGSNTGDGYNGLGGTQALYIGSDAASTFSSTLAAGGNLTAPTLTLSTGTIVHGSTTILNSSRELINIAELAINAAAAGSNKLYCNGASNFAGTMTIANNIQILGAADGVAYSFTGDTDTGVQSGGTNTLQLTTGGTKALDFDGNQLATFTGDVTVSNNSTDVDWSNNSNPVSTGGGGIMVSNQQSLDNTFSSIMWVAKETAGTDQNFAIINQSTAATTYTPKVYFAQRTAANTFTAALTIDESQNATFSNFLTVNNGYSGPDGNTGYRLKFVDHGGVHNDCGIGVSGSSGVERMWFNALNGFEWNIGTYGVKLTLTSAGLLTTAGGVTVGGDIQMTTAATSSKIRFGTSSWGNNIGLESYWSVHQTNRNEGWLFRDTDNVELLRIFGSNNGTTPRQATFGGTLKATTLTLSTGTIVHGSTTILNSSRELINIAELAINAAAAGSNKLYCNGASNFAGAMTVTTGDLTVEKSAVIKGWLTVGEDAAANSRYTTSGWSKYLMIDALNSGGGGIIWTKQSTSKQSAILSNHGKLEIGYSTATDNSAAWNPALIVDDDGKVGVGATSPQTEFQVGDYTDAAETITIATSQNGTGRINFYDNNNSEGGSIRVVGASSGSKMYFANRWNTDADKVTFDLITGRVGINDTTPSYSLDVNGTCRVTSGTTLNTLTATTVDTTGTVTIGNGAASTNGTLNLSGASGAWYGGRINIKRASATNGWVGSESFLGTNVDHLAVYGETGIEVAIYANASIKGRFTSTGLAVTGVLTATGAISGTTLTLSTGTIVHGSTTILNSSRELINIAELAINAAAAGSWKLYCNGIAYFNGNVIIGRNQSMNPRLILSSAAKSANLGKADTGMALCIDSGTSDNNQSVGHLTQIGLGLINTYQPAAIGAMVSNAAAYTSTHLVFATRPTTTDVAPTERMRIQDDGNVGIGTDDPSQKLHVYGVGVSSNIVLFESVVAHAWLQIKGNAGNSWQIGATNTGFRFYDDETSGYKFIIQNDGNVGIGDDTPTYKLDVNGTGRFTGQLTLGTGIIHGSTTILNSSRELINIAELAINAAAAGSNKLYCNGNANINGDCDASTFTGSGASLTSLNGSNISSGTVATARLGSGTASSSTFLRGDNTWAIPSGGGGGMTDWIGQDGDGTNVTISDGKYVKFKEGTGMDINWTDTSSGTSGDPYDLTFYVSTGVCMSIYTSYNYTTSAPSSRQFTFSSEGSVYAVADGYSTVKFSSYTSSDYRLKKNISTFNSEAWTKVKSVNLRKFDFDESSMDIANTVDKDVVKPTTLTDKIGWIAHELLEAGVEGAVTGSKDEVDADGNAVYQKVDPIKLIPVLWGALNEAITKIETLETKVQTLENN